MSREFERIARIRRQLAHRQPGQQHALGDATRTPAEHEVTVVALEMRGELAAEVTVPADGQASTTLVLTALLANARFVVYSATLAPHLRRLPLAPRLATGFVSIDGPLAVLMARQRQGPMVQRVAYLWGANTATWLTWCASSVAGIALAAVLPYGPELGYLGVLALFGIALPLLAGRPAWAAAAASAAVAIATTGWPRGLGTLAAVIAGIAAALWAGRGSAR